MQTAKAPQGTPGVSSIPEDMGGHQLEAEGDSDTSPASCQAPSIRASEKGLQVAGEGDSCCAHGDSTCGRASTVFTAATPFAVLSLNLQMPPRMPGISSGLALSFKIPPFT